MNLGDGPVERTDLRNDNSYNILKMKGRLCKKMEKCNCTGDLPQIHGHSCSGPDSDPSQPDQ